MKRGITVADVQRESSSKSEPMTADDIRAALRAGKRVVWGSEAYECIGPDGYGQFHIRCVHNGYCIGLTHQDGHTLNGKAEDFRIIEPKEQRA